MDAGTYYVVLELRHGYIWEDGTTEIKRVPWKILGISEEKHPEPAPIRVHIPEQIDPPYYDGEYKIPEWDEWNEFAIDVIGGTLQEVFADTYYVKVSLKPGYVWEDGTTEDKMLPWIIKPRDINIPDDNIHRDPAPERDDANNNGGGYCGCCCYCDTGLFDILKNSCNNDDGGCDCT